MLRTRLFGSISIINDTGNAAHVGPVCQRLLAYLVLPPRRAHPREHLADMFWGEHDPERARAALSTTLWRLRQAIEPPTVARGTYLVSGAHDEVSFNRNSPYWLDIEAFESRVSTVLRLAIEDVTPADAASMEAAFQLYEGPFMESFYDDWVLRRRENLHLLLVDGLSAMMRYYCWHGLIEEGLRCGKRILEIDPLREAIHRAVMRMHVESGQRPLAIRQYGACRDVLSAELGIVPMAETQRLYDEIRSGHPARPIAPARSDSKSPAALRTEIEQLVQAQGDAHAVAAGNEPRPRRLKLPEDG